MAENKIDFPPGQQDVPTKAEYEKNLRESVFALEALATHEYDERQKQPIPLEEAQALARNEAEPIPTAGTATTLEDAAINNKIADIVTPPTGTPEHVEQAREEEEDFKNGLRGGAYNNKRAEEDAKESALANSAIRKVDERVSEHFRSLKPVDSSAWTGRPDNEKFKSLEERFQASMDWCKSRGVQLSESLTKLGIGIKDNVVATARGVGHDLTAVGMGIMSPVESAKAIARGGKASIENFQKYIKYFKERREAGESTGKILGTDLIRLVEGYNTLPMHRKLEVTVALVLGAAVTGAAGATSLSFVLAKSMLGQRILSGAGFGVNRSRDEFIAEQANVVKYGYAAVAGTLYGATTMVAGHYATEHIKTWLSEHVFGHSAVAADQAPVRVKTNYRLSSSAARGAVASVGSAEHHMDWSYAKPGNGNDAFPTGTPDASVEVGTDTPLAPDAIDTHGFSPLSHDIGHPPVAEVSGTTPEISVTAPTGGGYEKLAQLLREKLEHSGMTAETAHGETKDLLSGHLTKAVHELAIKHGFYNADGTSVAIPEGSTLSVDAQGNIVYSAGGHVEAIANAPAGAHTTPEYRPASTAVHASTPEQAHMEQVNAARAKLGLAPLQHDTTLEANQSELARVGAQDAHYHSGNTAPPPEVPHTPEPTPAPVVEAPHSTEPTPASQDAIPNTGGIVLPEHAATPGSEAVQPSMSSPTLLEQGSPFVNIHKIPIDPSQPAAYGYSLGGEKIVYVSGGGATETGLGARMEYIQKYLAADKRFWGKTIYFDAPNTVPNDPSMPDIGQFTINKSGGVGMKVGQPSFFDQLFGRVLTLQRPDPNLFTEKYDIAK